MVVALANVPAKNKTSGSGDSIPPERALRPAYGGTGVHVLESVHVLWAMWFNLASEFPLSKC